MTIIERVLRAWAASPSFHVLHGPAGAEQIDTVQKTLGVVLPQSASDLYRFSNGGQVVGGNVVFHPLQGCDLSIERASQFLRATDWPVPAQLLIMGSDGQGDPWGLWSPGTPGVKPAIVSLGQIFEPESMAVVATSLERFLTVRTAYYSLLLGAPSVALDDLGLPVELRASNPDDRTWAAIRDWADPAMMGVSDDPYESRMTTEKVEALLLSLPAEEV